LKVIVLCQVAFSPDGRTLLAASFDATTSVWENVNGNFTPIAALEGHEHEVKAAVFDSSGVYVATCSRDKSVWIWEKDEGDFDCVSVLHGHTQDVKSVLWHPTEVCGKKGFGFCVTFFAF
jgi:WD40 repeat protein